MYNRDMEEWRDIKGYEGRYKISNLGRCSSLLSKKAPQGTDLVPQLRNNGYEVYHLRKEGKSYMRLAHRLVAEAFIPNPNKLPTVNHKDGNKRNNHVENLEWASYLANMHHSIHTLGHTRNKGRGVPVRCIETGRVYSDSRAAGRELNIHPSNIDQAARHAVKKDRRGYSYTVHTAGNYHWEKC